MKDLILALKNFFKKPGIFGTIKKGNKVKVLVGKDKNGNKYYQSKSGKRWVIYKGEVEASKIPNEWYSWMHYINNKIENQHDLKKYNWQKEHLPNQTGSIPASIITG